MLMTAPLLSPKDFEFPSIMLSGVVDHGMYLHFKNCLSTAPQTGLVVGRRQANTLGRIFGRQLGVEVVGIAVNEFTGGQIHQTRFNLVAIQLGQVTLGHRADIDTGNGQYVALLVQRLVFQLSRTQTHGGHGDHDGADQTQTGHYGESAGSRVFIKRHVRSSA